MAACCGKSKSDLNNFQDTDQAKPLDVIPNNDLPLFRIHQLLDNMGNTSETKNKDSIEKSEHSSEDEQGCAHAEALKQSDQMTQALITTSKL